MKTEMWIARGVVLYYRGRQEERRKRKERELKARAICGVHTLQLRCIYTYVTQQAQKRGSDTGKLFCLQGGSSESEGRKREAEEPVRRSARGREKEKACLRRILRSYVGTSPALFPIPPLPARLFGSS